MSPRPFYEIKPTHYLFNLQESPEEKVRQWVLFELLSTYRIHINNLEIEKPVRVGTRTHRADIVIYQNHIPHIVIECKKQDDKKVNEALEQAISYANCLGAKFAVYTNGKNWQVRRLLDSSWVVVPDIPFESNNSLTKDLGEFADNYKKLMSLIYWTYKPIPVEYRDYIYTKLQEFFLERHWYCKSQQELLLCESADDLFRVAFSSSEAEYNATENRLIFKNDYIVEKSIYAYREFLMYCKMIGFSGIGTSNPDEYLGFDKISFNIRMRVFLADLGELVVQCRGLSNLEVNVIKLMKLVMDHLWDDWHLNQRTEIPNSIMIQFLKIAEPICETYFNITIPELEDRGSWEKFRCSCWNFEYSSKKRFPESS